jgi:hypothetical protein
MWWLLLALGDAYAESNLCYGGGTAGIEPRWTTIHGLDDAMVGLEDYERSYHYDRILFDMLWAKDGISVDLRLLSGVMSAMAYRTPPSLEVRGSAQGAGRMWDHEIVALWFGAGPHGDTGGVTFGAGFDTAFSGYGQYGGGEGGMHTSAAKAAMFAPGLRIVAYNAFDETVGLQARATMMMVRTNGIGSIDGWAAEFDMPLLWGFSPNVGLFVDPLVRYENAGLADDDADRETMLTAGFGVGLLYGAGD